MTDDDQLAKLERHTLALMFLAVVLWLVAALVFALGAPAAACWVFMASGVTVIPAGIAAYRAMKLQGQI